MDLLNLYRSNYEAKVSKDKNDKVSLSMEDKKYIFTLGMLKDLGNADKKFFQEYGQILYSMKWIHEN